MTYAEPDEQESTTLPGVVRPAPSSSDAYIDVSAATPRHIMSNDTYSEPNAGSVAKTKTLRDFLDNEEGEA